MLRKTLRHFSGDWLRFFIQDKKYKPGVSRSLKEISDFNKFCVFLEESVYNSFNDVSDSDFLEVVSQFNYLNKNIKKSFKKDSKILSEIVEIIIFKADKEKSLKWTHQNISNFFLFLKNQPSQLKNFSEDTLNEILSISQSKVQDFYTHELGIMTFSTSYLFPNHCDFFWKFLVEKLKNEESFDFMKLNTLLQIFYGLFSVDPKKSKQEITENPKFEIFFKELLKKIQSGSISDLINSFMLECLNNLPEDLKQRLILMISEKIYSNIQEIKEVTEDKNLLLIDVLSILSYFDSADNKKIELFTEINNKILLRIVSKQNWLLRTSNDYFTSNYLVQYLITARKLNLFQVSLMDRIILSVHHEMNSKVFRLNPGVFSECMSSLAFLNYPGRFTTKIPHKELYWLAWEGIVNKFEDHIISSTNQPDSDESEYNVSVSRRNLNFLWTLCVFNIHSVGILQNLLDSNCLKADEICEEEDFRKLFQVHYWLCFENKGLFSLNPEVIEKMKEFKKKIDSNPVAPAWTEFKIAVKQDLVDNEVGVTEDFSDYPYVLDFVNAGKKKALLLDDESKYLNGTKMLIKNGFFKVMNRQLASLGWMTQKISLRTWLNLGTPSTFLK